MWESSKILDDFDFDETFANPKRSNVIEANINESPFDNLPEEVTRRIFSYLPITSIAQLSRVCKHWQTFTWKHANLDFSTASYQIRAKLLKVFNDAFLLSLLSKTSNLSVLDVWGLPIQDTTMRNICTISTLKTLNLRMTNITSAGLKYLPSLPSMENLSLSSKTTDDDLRIIGQLTNLKILHLGSSPNITSKGISHLANLKKLEDLNLSGCELIGDSGLKPLTTLSDSIKRLSLSFTNITDRAVQYLLLLDRLEVLTMSNCCITDVFLHFIHLFKSLKTLNVSYCYGITENGVNFLSRLSNITTNTVGCLPTPDTLIPGSQPLPVGPQSSQLPLDIPKFM